MSRVWIVVFLCLAHINAFADDICIEVVHKDSAYLEKAKATTKEEKNYYKMLMGDEKDLLSSLLQQVSSRLDKNTLDTLKEGCLLINHDPKLTKLWLAYSAEKDPAYMQRDNALYNPKTHPNSTIRMNVTENFIKMLAYEKDKSADKKTYPPAVLAYAASFIVREAYIAAAYKKAPLRILKSRMATLQRAVDKDKKPVSWKKDDQGTPIFLKDVSIQGVKEVIVDEKIRVQREKMAIDAQQRFIQPYNDVVIEWAEEASVVHPDFFKEKTLIYASKEDDLITIVRNDSESERKNTIGTFLEINPLFFEGQYRPCEIVFRLILINQTYNGLKYKKPEEYASQATGFSVQNIEDGKKDALDLQREWKNYINETPESEMLMSSVMENLLDSFIYRYQVEVEALPTTFRLH